MNNIYQYIIDLFVGNGLIIAVGTFVTGEIIKKSIKVIHKDFIPLIGGIIGILLGIFIPDIFAGKDLLTAAICGLALGWASTGGYETVKNLVNRKEESE